MIRVLFMIAAAGFVLCIGAFAAAFAIGGPDAISRGGWTLVSGDWDKGDWKWGDRHGRHDHGWDWDEAESGPQSSRTLAWSGADRLDLDLAADVRYIQAPGPGAVTVTGPKRWVDRVVIKGDSIRYDHGHHGFGPKLTIVVRAPNIDSFDVSGQNSLAIEGYHQSKLRLDVSGDADVTAVGEVDEISLDVSGSGDVDLGQLKAKGASVDMSGAADATIAPTEWAKLDISGAGDIRLLTHPAKLETDVSGVGKVRTDGPSPSPSPFPSPSPSPSPSPPPAKTS